MVLFNIHEISVPSQHPKRDASEKVDMKATNLTVVLRVKYKDVRFDLIGQQGENRTTLVFFLGGVTYAEIAALRFLSQMEDGGTEYIIATTKLINGTSWIKSLMDRPEAQIP